MRICDCRIFRIFQKNALRIFFSVNMAFSTAILISFVFLNENAKYADILALQIENIQKRATEMLSKAATNKLVNSQINYPSRSTPTLLAFSSMWQVYSQTGDFSENSQPDILYKKIPITHKFWTRALSVIFTARCYASAVLAMALSVCLSVRHSRCSTKTAKRTITQTTPHDSPGTLLNSTQLNRVLRTQVSDTSKSAS